MSKDLTIEEDDSDLYCAKEGLYGKEKEDVPIIWPKNQEELISAVKQMTPYLYGSW